MSDSKTRTYVCYWDCLGFECIVEMTKWEASCLLNTIAGKPLDPPPVSLNYLMLRARANSQRDPEVWTFETTHEIDESFLVQLSKSEPQQLVDLIRSHGKKLYGAAHHQKIIT